MKSRLLVFVAASLLLASNAYSQAGQTYVWSGPSGGDWTVAANWTPSRDSLASTDILVFNGGGTVTVTNTGGGGEEFGYLHVTNHTSLTLTGSPDEIEIDNDLTIDVGSTLNSGGLSGDLYVYGATTISGTWTGSGTGDLGYHEFDGVFTINAGGVYSLATTGSQYEIWFDDELVINGTFTTPSNRDIYFGGQTISGTSVITFNNGFLADGDMFIAAGTTIKAASGKTLLFHYDVEVEGRIDGADASSVLQLQTYSYSTPDLILDDGIISIANVEFANSSTFYLIEGTGTFTNSTIRVENNNTLQLASDLNMTGGAIEVNYGNFNVNGYELTLDGSSFAVASSGSVYGGDETIFTKGNCTIVQGGYFDAHLWVESGTTTAWSEPIGFGKTELSKVNSIKLIKGKPMKLARDGGGYYDFQGQITVDPGATLIIPSGKVLALDPDYSTLSESPTARTLGSVLVVQYCETGYDADFAGMGLSIHPFGTSPGTTTVTRTTGLAPSLSGGTAIKRVFDIVPTTNTGLNATLTFAYLLTEVGGANESTLHLYRSPDGSTWADMGGTANPGSHTVTLSGINAFSKWTAASPLPAPIIASISPSSATVGSTLNLTVLGSNFGLGATSASFSGGGITVNSVTVNSSTQLTVNITITPAASPTYRDLLVTNSYGTGTYSNGFQVRYPAPTITSIAPTSGAQGESLSVTLQGSGFISGVTTVSFGAGVTVNSFSVTNDHTSTAQITIAPGAAVGTRDVSVTDPIPGGGTATLSAAFTVISPNPVPTLVSVSPNTGVRGQVLSVILNGSNFVNGVSSVNFGGDIGLDSVKVLSGTQIQARLTISYSAATGTRSVSVTNATPGGGTATLASAFTVTNPAPTVTSVVPGTGARGKLVNVTINGTGFIPGVTNAVPVAGLTLVSVTFVSTTQIIGSFLIERDAALGFRDMTISNSGPGGGSATLAHAFEVQNPSPAVLSVSPNSGLTGQSLSVVVAGTDFISGVSNVDFGAGITVGAVTVDSTGTHLTAGITIASGAAAGSRSVTVTNSGPGGGSSALANAFTIANLAPTLTTLSTYAAGRGQTLNVTMTGTNFATGVTTASFGVGITVNLLTVSSPTSAIANITVATSAIIGARSVSVTNAPPGGGTATLVSVFNVGNPTPTVLTIAPASGVRGQTLDVVITGTGFVSGTSTLTLGLDIAVNSFTVTSFTQINANITIAGAAGGRDVSVSNGPPGGGSGLLAAGFTVNNPLPTLSSLSPSSANRGSIVNVTVTGSQFITGVTSLSFGADIVVNSMVVKSPTEILANITLASLAASGSRTVTVTNASPGGGSANLPAGFTVGTGTATSVEGNMGIVPDQFVLQEAYPNPFNPSTRIRYGVPEDSRVRIVIHNMLGNIVAELVNGDRSKGTYELLWHADYLPSGVYLVRMNAESTESTKRYISSRKIIFMK